MSFDRLMLHCVDRQSKRRAVTERRSKRRQRQATVIAEHKHLIEDKQQVSSYEAGISTSQ